MGSVSRAFHGRLDELKAASDAICDILEDDYPTEETIEEFMATARGYFGSYIVDVSGSTNYKHGTMFSMGESEDAAYGDIYRTLAEEFPYTEGYRIRSITVNPHPVSVLHLDYEEVAA